jgi:hypothetical protein
MNIKIKHILFMLLLLSTINYAQVNLPFNSLRIAYYACNATTDVIPEGFLLRAKAAGYTHVLAEYQITLHQSEWSNGYYVGSSMRNGLTNAFKRVNSYGMKLIPEFQSGSYWSGHWAATNNPNIQWEYIDYGSGNVQRSTTPVFAPNPSGMDLSFEQLINMINDAFNATNMNYSLDYIHIGHDEPFYNNGSTSGLAVGRSDLDQNWIATHPATLQNTSIQLLMADEISRRVNAIKTKIPSACVLIYGDAWDPEQNGGPFNTANVINAPAVQNSSVKNNLIVIPWQYDQYYGSNDYNSQTAFNHFSNSGIAFLFGSALTDGNAFPSLSRFNQISEYILTSQLPTYRNRMAGFVVFNWGGVWDNSKSIYNQMQCFNGLEHVSHLAYYGTQFVK